MKTDQKFNVGDIVRVRSFDEIDTDDIGSFSYHKPPKYPIGSCLGIQEDIINDRSAEGDFIIHSHHYNPNRGAHVYELRKPGGGVIPCYWAQGMLDFPVDESVKFDPPDPESLIGFLFG